jgi:hypothetical protein
VEGAAVYRHEGEVQLVEGGCAPWYKDVAVDAGRDPPADWGPVPRPEELSEAQVGPFSGEEG